MYRTRNALDHHVICLAVPRIEGDSTRTIVDCVVPLFAKTTHVGVNCYVISLQRLLRMLDNAVTNPIDSKHKYVTKQECVRPQYVHSVLIIAKFLSPDNFHF